MPKRTRRSTLPNEEQTPEQDDTRVDDNGSLVEEEPEGEDLFGDNYLRDYQGSVGSSSGGEDDVQDESEFIVPDDEVEEDAEGAAQLGLTYPQQLELERVLQERRRRAGNEDDEFGSVNSRDESHNDDDEDELVEGSSSDSEGDNDEGSATEAATGGNDGKFQGIELPTGGAVAKYAIDDPVYLNERLADEVEFDWMSPQVTEQEMFSQELFRRVVRNRIFYFLAYYSRSAEDEELLMLDSGAASESVSKGRGMSGVTQSQGVSQAALDKKTPYTYQEALQTMVQNNEQSFEVLYWDLGKVYNSVLATWLAAVPTVMISLFEEVANYLLYRIMFPYYYKVHKRIYVRITGLSICDPIRNFRQMHMNVLVRVEGVVIRRSGINPQLLSVKYDCVRCRFVIGPILQRGDREVKVSVCPSCQSKGPFRVNMALTEFRNHQTIVLQEPPGKVPPGRLPRSLEVVLVNDLIDRAKPGDTVEITGVYKNVFDPLLNTRQGFPVFTTTLVANNVTRRGAESGRNAFGITRTLSRTDRDRLIQLSRHPNIKQKLLNSIAPSIHGREDIKLGLLLSLLGGVAKDVGGNQSHRIRGDINVLLVGDPGCAKSQFLKYVTVTADRAVFTTGRGSSAVGLTASVQKDPITGEFVLEGGALVIADRGVCCIDEFDKMSDQDRTSIHEAMEQQTISVARGGIVTTLLARCSIIAAANPVGGRYDPSASFDANVNLTSPILSRFDLLFVVRDEINPELDEKLAMFICKSHFKNHPLTRAEMQARHQRKQERLIELRNAYQTSESEEERMEVRAQIEQLRETKLDSGDSGGIIEDVDPNTSNPLPQAVLRQYIQFARAHCTPRVTNVDEDAIVRVYTELRQQSRNGGISITVRHMESLIRLSEAHAKIRLQDYVKDEDVTAAIAFFLRCFLQTQKYSARTALNQHFCRFIDADKEVTHLLHFKLKTLIAQTRQYERQISGDIDPVAVSVDFSELEAIADQLNVSREALHRYVGSTAFSQEFTIEKGLGGTTYVKHTLVPTQM